MDRDQYEKQLRERIADHMEKVRQTNGNGWQPCAHDACDQCNGTGIKLDGSRCVHMICCQCPRCNPVRM